MVKKSFLFAILFSLFFTLITSAEINIKTPAWQKVKDSGSKGNYTFLFSGDAKTAEGKNMLANLNAIKQETSGKKIEIVKILPDDPKEKDLISLFKIKDNPTVLAVAPNGAITGYFSKIADKKSLDKSLVSLKEAEIVKNLQENKVVFLCFYKEKEANFTGIKTDLEAINSNFKGAVKIIYAVNDNKQEELKNKFKMPADKTVVFIVVPSGQIAAKLEGADITKENLMKALVKCSSGCGPGACN